MSHNINYSVLPWYDEVAKQHHRRDYVRSKDIYPLVAVQGFVPPFQIIRPKSTNAITLFKLINLNTLVETDLLTEMNTAGLTITKYVDYTNDITDNGTNAVVALVTSWGWTLGIPQQFDAVRFKANMHSPSNLGTYWNVKIKTSPTGSILAESTLTRTQTSGINTIEVGFSSIIDNDALAPLWIEVISDGMWATIGNQAGALPTNYTYWPVLANFNSNPPVVPASYDYDAWTQTTCQLAYDIIQYPGVTAMATLPAIGNYYCKISDNVNTFYSDVFNIRTEVNNYLKIIFWHDEAMVFKGGHIRFKYPFKYYFYAATEIAVPTYEIEREVQKRNGYDYPIRTTTYKLFKTRLMVTEYILDMLRLIVHCSEVVIENIGFTYYVDRFDFTPKWEAWGDFAEAEIEFTTDTVITTTGLGKKLSTAAALGDFDQDDYNEDFLI